MKVKIDGGGLKGAVENLHEFSTNGSKAAVDNVEGLLKNVDTGSEIAAAALKSTKITKVDGVIEANDIGLQKLHKILRKRDLELL